MFSMSRFRNTKGEPVDVDKLKPLPVDDILAPTTAFNERSVAENTPIIQFMSVYGFSAEKNDIFLSEDGAVSIKDRQYNATTGMIASAGSALLSKRRLTYKPGQGIVARFTSLFNNPVPGTIMVAGLISATDRLGFGYSIEGKFGIEYSHDGILEIQDLTITTAATGDETATITVDGIAYDVDLTAGSINHNTYEIARELSIVVPLYQFTSNQDVVTARADVAFPAGAFEFVSDGIAAASWVQISAAALPDSTDFINQENFNGGIDLTTFDPTMGNVYQVSMQYLGFGAIRFYIENAINGKFELVHTIEFANNHIVPSVVNPSFRIGIFAANATGTVSEGDLSMSSAFGAIEGKAHQTEPPRATDIEGTVTTVNRSILTIRNRIVFNDIANRVEILPILLTLGTDSVKPVIVEVIVNAVHTGDVIYDYEDENNSVTEISIDQNSVTAGRLKYSFVLPAGGADTLALSELRAIMLPGETFTVAARVASGGGSAAMLVGLSWQEDL